MKVTFTNPRSVSRQLRRLAEAVAEEGLVTRYKIDGSAVAMCFGVFNMQSFTKPEHAVIGLLFAALFARDNPGSVIDFGGDV